MPTKTTREITPDSGEEVLFQCVLPDPPPNPPISYPAVYRTIQIPGFQTKYQKFWDESWNGDRKTWKNCENYKALTKPAKGQGSTTTLVEFANSSPFYSTGKASSVRVRYRNYSYHGSHVDHFGAPGYPIAGLPAFDQPNALDGTFVPPPANLENLNSLALKVMLPKIKEELSIVNSLIELKDFRRLPGLARKFIDIVPLIRSKLRSGKPLKALRDFVRLPSELYLTYSFAIAPLVKDIAGVYAALTKYQAEISDLISRSGKMQTRHFMFKWNEFPVFVDDLSPLTGLCQPGYVLVDPAYTWKQRRLTRTFASEFHAEIQYNYNYTKFQIAHKDCLAILAKLGIGFNGQILWNALPWSFVIDWLFDVNRFIGQYANKPLMDPIVNIHQYLWSIKRKREITVLAVCNTNHPAVSSLYTAGSTVSLPGLTETAYRRQVGLPGYSSLTSSGLSLKELSLGAALVSTSGRYRGPRRITPPQPRS